ncbi:putative disease resistance protein RGA4 [Camellia lanceoleosa]|uniref:Disease resistance protein RGA4 n=1 Tax=Camellia lanceoleosa TaxID=1840588 RepID=A0ACC0F1R6_9ERIC|nr:putative disease resistance protein RGA4 [Camellia lanceoleosa]
MKSLVLATLLRVVFEKLASPILNKFQSHTEFNKKMKKLQDRWLTIQAVIEDVEKRQLRDAKVKLWLKKLKDVAYDADDLLNSITAQALRNNNNKKNIWNFSVKPIFN